MEGVLAQVVVAGLEAAPVAEEATSAALHCMPASKYVRLKTVRNHLEALPGIQRGIQQ